MVIEFRINCIPRGQARVRHAVIHGHSRAYKTKEQQQDEATLQALLMPHKPQNPLSGAISLRVACLMPIPRSKSKKWQNNALQGYVLPTGKPDLDNVAKHLIDCLVSMRFIEDDKQIVRLNMTKMYGDQPGYDIILEEC